MRRLLLLVPLLTLGAAFTFPTTAAAATTTATRPASATKISLDDRIDAWHSAALTRPVAPKPSVPQPRAAMATAATTVTTVCGNRSPVPIPPGGAPYETWSRYVGYPEKNKVGDAGTNLYDMGFYQGCASDQQRGSSSSLRQIVILDFGDPGLVNGRYGAWDHAGYHPIGTTTEANSIEWSVMRYMIGFWTGTVINSGSFMTVLVGTNNHKYEAATGDNGAPVNYAHGRAWALMVRDLNQWISAVGYGTQLIVEAANDMETSWAYYSQTLDWANGFASVGGATYYDFGDAGGCPTSGSGECVAGPLNGGHMGWSTANEYTLAWGLPPAFAIPEIYYSYQAQQWYHISLAGVTSGGSRIYFTAGLSQHNTCGCTNTYDQSWSQLQNAVNADSRTSGRILYTTEMSRANP